MNLMDQLVMKYLRHLGVERREPTLDYLNELIAKHQRKVPWENLTKILDTQMGHELCGFIPPIELYVGRMVEQGTGGLCWTHARAFHWLLGHLGYDVKFVYMDPGHLCLRVDLDQAYYVDVGYCAPLYQAYPMFESFVAENEREVFHYNARPDGSIEVVRVPGPTKVLNPEPREYEEFAEMIIAANDWSTAMFLKETMIFGYVDGWPTSLNGNVLKVATKDGKTEKVLSEDEMIVWVEKFGIDPDVYRKAKAILDSKQKG